MRDDDECLTWDIPTAGRILFGLSKNSSYAAAARGDIPVVQVGRLKRVPKELARQLLKQSVSGSVAAGRAP
jgi:hypothetical protein